MKKVVNVLGLIILAAIAGYGAYWYVLTNQAETKFKEHLAKWQEEHPNEKFTYDNISKEGFPSHIKIRIDNPQYSTKLPDTKGRLDSKLLGALTLSDSLWTKEKSIEMQGEGSITFPPTESSPTLPKLTWKGTNVLTLESNTTGHFEIFKAMFDKENENEAANAKEDKTPSFRSLKSSLSEYHFKGHIDENTPIDVNGGPFESKITRREYKKDQEEVVFTFNQKDLTINAPPTKVVLSTLFYAPNDLGKITFNVDGSFCYPSMPVINEYASNPLHPRQAEVCFKVDRANFVSDLGKSDTQNFVLALQQDQNRWTVTLKGVSDGSYTKKYDEAVRKSLATLLKDPDYIKQFVGDDKGAQKKVMDAAPEIVDLLPEASAMGTASMKIDLTASADIKDNIVDHGSGELRTLDYTIPPYNLNLASKVNFQRNFTDPVAQGTLKIARYKQLIELLSNYSNRVITVYNNANVDSKDAPVPTVKPDDTKKVLAFLRNISDDPTKEPSDLRVTFSYNDKDLWKVGTLTMPDFLEQAMKLYISLAPNNIPGQLPAGEEAPAPVPQELKK